MRLKLQRFNILVLVVLVLGSGISSVFAQQLSDPDDRISVSVPIPNRYVTGGVPTSFTLVDDDQSAVPYTVMLRNNVCTNAIATIKTGNAPSGTLQNLTWNSAGPIGSVASISDGKYCLEVCGSFRDGSTMYSACNSRYVLIRNNNSNPVITTSVPNNRTIFRNQGWQYDVNATDVEGDRLTFSLAQAPSFLSINKFTGLIYTNGKPKPIGTHNVRVKVVDGFGGRDTQSFSLTVRQRPPQPSSSSSSSQSSSSTSSASSSQSSTTSSAQEINIEFVSPASGDVFGGDENAVAWQINGYEPNPEDQILLNLLIDGDDAVQLAQLSGDETTYNLDVSSLDENEYRLELVLNIGDDSYSQQSGLFTVENEEDPGEQNNRPLINNVSPEDGAELIDEAQPEISGEFVAPQDSEIDVDTFKFLFDDVERDWCDEVTQTGFKCTPDTALSPGLHKVRVSIADDQNRSTPLEWTFSIEYTDTTDPDESGGFVIFGRVLDASGLIVLLILCLVLIMLFGVPWILYIVWRRRQENDEYSNTSTSSSVTTTSTYQPDQELSPPTSVLDSFANEPATTSDSSYVSTPDYGIADLEVGNTDSTASDTSASSVTTSNTTTSTTTDDIDPLQFDSYEDYLAAVSGEPANTTTSTTTTDTNTTKDTGDSTGDQSANSNYVSSPDYADLYTATPSTGSEVKDNKDEENKNDSPDWLNPV